MLPNTETWLPVLGFEGVYSASSLGRIRRDALGGAAVVGRILKPCKDPAGYLRVKLSINGVCRTYKVHRIIAESFLGAIAPKLTVNHIDGIKTNNAASNLEIVTRGENISHAFRVIKTKSVSGELNPRARLTQSQVETIREMLAEKMRQTEIAKVFGVSKHLIYDIKHKRSWA